ncbi:MAG: hypothetical protein HXX19_18945 [Rhodoferax sp.]|nr:hypothetical protein [Rhodoferax sp.]
MTTNATENPISLYFDTDGSPLNNGSIYFGIASQNPETNPITVYWDAAGTQPAAQPIKTVNGMAARNGTPAVVYTGSDYSSTVRNKKGALVQTFQQASAFSIPLQMQASLAAPGGSSLIGFLAGLVGSVSQLLQSKLRRYADVGDVGIISDGVTDQTAALLAFFTANSTYRGTVLIPYNTKFTKSTVYAAVPVGMILIDDSSINTGQPPSYKNKVRRTYTNDAVNDDMATELASSHHPALRLNNLGTAGTGSATNYYHSIIRSAGFRWNNDPIDGMQSLTYKSPRGTFWRTADILNTPYNYAINAATRWTALTPVLLNALMNTSSGAVWKCSVAGTTASTEPTGTGPFVDGTVTWTYQGLWSAGATVTYYDEDGYGGISSFSTGIARWGAETSTSAGLSINCNSNTGDTFLRDDKRGQDLWRLSTANGLQTGAIPSLQLGGAISGATPALTSQFHYVNNGGATNMTNMTLPASQVRGFVTLLFSTAFTTIKATGFNTKGGIDVTPPAGGLMVFLLEPTLSGNWYEVSRSF